MTGMCALTLALAYTAIGVISTARASGAVREYQANGITISHNQTDEGMYYDTPPTEVAYNVQVLKTESGNYCTVYHSEPRKAARSYPGDSIKAGVEKGAFSYRMPADKDFRLFGDPRDSKSMMYSPEAYGIEGWGGAGNPMVIKGKPGDRYYYVFCICVGDDNQDRQGDDFRHYLCQTRTRDFVRYELRTQLGGKAQWKPFSDAVPMEWRRPYPVIDAKGNPVRGRFATPMPDTQGLIGSICYVGGLFHFFCTDVDTDGKTYLFHRTASDIGSLDPKSAGWSDAERISGELMHGTVMRVAKARAMNRWAVLYNGYKDVNGDGALRPDLFVQYTKNLSIKGEGGLSEIRFFDRMVGNCGVSDKYLGLASGGGVFAQHYFLTDAYGNLTIPTQEAANRSRAGMLTWADFSSGVYGGKVYRAGWEATGAK